MIEFDERDKDAFEEIMEVLKRHPTFDQLSFNEESVLSLPGLDIYSKRRKVVCNGQDIKLTVKEYDLLKMFAANVGQVLTYEQIYRTVWKEIAQTINNSTINYHINNLKKKILSVLPEPKFEIRCLREIGYCLDIISE